jgi:hypothetical protein
VLKTAPELDVTCQPFAQLLLIGASVIVSLRFMASLLADARSLTRSSATVFELMVPIKLTKLGAATAASIPKIEITTNTSTSVNPRT